MFQPDTPSCIPTVCFQERLASWADLKVHTAPPIVQPYTPSQTHTRHHRLTNHHILSHTHTQHHRLAHTFHGISRAGVQVGRGLGTFRLLLPTFNLTVLCMSAAWVRGGGSKHRQTESPPHQKVICLLSGPLPLSLHSSGQQPRFIWAPGLNQPQQLPLSKCRVTEKLKSAH